MNNNKADKLDNINNDKILTSFYLLPSMVEKVDDFLFYAKKGLPIEKRRKLTKTFFYETCLQVVLEEYQEKGEKSSLLKAIYKLLNN